MSKKSDFEYLDEERRKLWADILDLRNTLSNLELSVRELNDKNEALADQVEKKTSDYQKEARNASSQTTRYKNKAADSAAAADSSRELVENLATKAQQISETLSQFKTLGQQLEGDRLSLNELAEATTSKFDLLADKILKADEFLEQSETIVDAAKTISSEITEVKEEADSVSTKIGTAHSQAIKRSKEIVSLHEKVFGYSTEDEETGKSIKIEGLEAELKEAYSDVKNNVEAFGEEVTAFKDQQVALFKTFSQDKEEEFSELKTRIEGLLPDAMTAGLSHAYELKRKSEEEERIRAGKAYFWTIMLLLVISLLPVVVSLYSFFHDDEKVNDIIRNIPRIMLATLPLYAPAFWFAISASKRIKLARRLTEEYAHKEVLSKTFEGLSTQISKLPESEISKELRVRLLYNIVTVSSENPGRLISDYNSSDNPLMEVLDKSLSLTKSLEKIAGIPGVNRILKKVERKREGEIEKMEQSVQENIPSESDSK